MLYRDQKYLHTLFSSFHEINCYNTKISKYSVKCINAVLILLREILAKSKLSKYTFEIRIHQDEYFSLPSYYVHLYPNDYLILKNVQELSFYTV